MRISNVFPVYQFSISALHDASSKPTMLLLLWENVVWKNEMRHRIFNIQLCNFEFLWINKTFLISDFPSLPCPSVIETKHKTLKSCSNFHSHIIFITFKWDLKNQKNTTQKVTDTRENATLIFKSFDQHQLDRWKLFIP